MRVERNRDLTFFRLCMPRYGLLTGLQAAGHPPAAPHLNHPLPQPYSYPDSPHYDYHYSIRPRGGGSQPAFSLSSSVPQDTAPPSCPSMAAPPYPPPSSSTAHWAHRTPAQRHPQSLGSREKTPRSCRRPQSCSFLISRFFCRWAVSAPRPALLPDRHHHTHPLCLTQPLAAAHRPMPLWVWSSHSSSSMPAADAASCSSRDDAGDR